MDSNKLANWLQVVASIGLLGGLVLVGLQIKQNSNLLRVQLTYEESRRYTEIEVAMLGEDPAAVWEKSLLEPAELTLREQRIMEAYIWLAVENWRAAYKVSGFGLMGDEWRERVQMDTLIFLNSPYARAVWKQMSESVPGEIVDLVNGLLAQDSFNQMDYQKQILKDATKEQGDS